MSKLSHSNPNLDDVLHKGNEYGALGKYAAMEMAKKRTNFLLNDIGSLSLASMLAKAYLQGLKDAHETFQP